MHHFMLHRARGDVIVSVKADHAIGRWIGLTTGRAEDRGHYVRKGFGTVS